MNFMIASEMLIYISILFSVCRFIVSKALLISSAALIVLAGCCSIECCALYPCCMGGPGMFAVMKGRRLFSSVLAITVMRDVGLY